MLTGRTCAKHHDFCYIYLLQRGCQHHFAGSDLLKAHGVISCLVGGFSKQLKIFRRRSMPVRHGKGRKHLQKQIKVEL